MEVAGNGARNSQHPRMIPINVTGTGVRIASGT